MAKKVAIALVLLLIAISVLPPFIMFLRTGDISYWVEAFKGLIVPWWVGLPGIVIAIVIITFAMLDLEDYL